MPPNRQKGGVGTANPEHRPNGQIAANSKAQSSRSAGARHESAQTPIARFVLVHEHRPGRRTADAIPLDHCPVCGFQSTHKTAWPPGETLRKACTTCGHRDEFAVIEIKAGSRTRRRA